MTVRLMGVSRKGFFSTLGRMSESEWTKILGWPGYRVYRSEINEEAKTLRLWVRRKRGNRKLEYSGWYLTIIYETGSNDLKSRVEIRRSESVRTPARHKS